MEKIKNQAFIDGQNLHLGITRARPSWRINLQRFRVYLREKYNVDEAYYFLGCIDNDHEEIYNLIQRAGFILVFREHNPSMIGKKKGNVDTDIVFSIMKKIADKEKLNKIVLVSGDGDYVKMVKYLISKNKLEKVLAPSHKSISSLYKSLIDNKFYTFLDNENVKKKIAAKNKKNAGSP